MRYWNLLFAVFVASILLGIALDLLFVDERVLELWESRNRLFLRDRAGLVSAVVSVSHLVLYVACAVLFWKKHRWAPTVFILQVALNIGSTLHFGPRISTVWSSVLAIAVLYTGAFMSAIILSGGNNRN